MTDTTKTRTTIPEGPSAKKPRKKRASTKEKVPRVVTIKNPYPPQFGDLNPPKTVWRNKVLGTQETVDKWGNKFKGVLHLAGHGAKNAPIVFISPCVLTEELVKRYNSGELRMLRGPAANLFTRSLNRSDVRIEEEDYFYTALVKYNVPKLKPKAVDIRWGTPALRDELLTIKPKIIVCLGKTVFDFFFKKKFKLSEIQGGWFRSEEYNCLLYPMDTIITPLFKPEYLERFIVDLRQVKQALDETRGIVTPKLATDYHTITHADQLINLMTELKDRRLRYLTVDCEWDGQTYVQPEGKLRSFQLSAKPGHAVYVRLMDDKLKYAFDQPLEVVRQIIDPVFNDPEVKFVGHNLAADLVWMKHHLGVKIYKRSGFDTMFAQHTINEYADLKLERNAVKYTDLGRYDVPLTLWKKENKFDEEEHTGYGKVPDKIIIPYAQRDVDATSRIHPILWQALIKENLQTYYFTLILPFVTDGFVELMETGLSINRNALDDMRSTFVQNREILLASFRKKIEAEASLKMYITMCSHSPASGKGAFLELFQLIQQCRDSVTGVIDQRCDVFAQALLFFKAFCGTEKMPEMLPIFFHWVDSRMFNINSTDHLRRWFFKVKGFIPFKTTKKDGVQMAWDRVITMGKEAEFQPAVDKQTIKVFSQKDSLVGDLEQVKLVGNVIKAFLNEPNPETGKESGIHKWIQPDGKIHPNYSLTETARPRSWKPNVLNWPKYISKPIENSFKYIRHDYVRGRMKEMRAMGASKEQMRMEASQLIRKETSLRSCVHAPDGYCYIDMDLRTAEVVALAQYSGDSNLLKVLYERDTQFGRISEKDPKKVLRVCYNGNEGIPESEWDTKLLVSPHDDRFLRDNEGKLLHPLRDIHWEMGTGVMGKPREKLDENLHRGMGKVGNFSIPYAASASLLERMCEVNTGKKPPEGTGQKMRDTHAARYPVATRFQENMEKKIEDPGWYRSVSGRVRHFFYNYICDLDGLNDYTKDGLLSGLNRQARNFPCQELVAATTAKALIRFMEERDKLGLDAKIFMLLYDAMSLVVPLEQVKAASELLKNCLTVWTPWDIDGRVFNFDVDVSYGFRWGCKPTAQEKAILAKYV